MKQPKLSLIIPSYNEAENIPILLSELTGILAGLEYEILVVDDDSPDRTGELVEAFARTNPAVRVIRRQGERGLSTAVVAGWRAARGSYLGVMDADRSHDANLLPAMVREMDAGAELVVGSRRVPGGGADNWPWYRRLYSNAATCAARFLLGVTLHDPMSGFFMVRREAFLLCLSRLRPRGYKILLEVAVKSEARKTVELPYVFRDRRQGYSKLSGGVVVSYIKQLIELWIDRRIQSVRKFWHTTRYRKVAACLKPGQLLDMGCGRPCESMPDGAFLKFVGRGVGLDRGRLCGVLPFVRGDALALPFARRSVSNVVAMELLEHVPDHPRVFGEILRVMKDDGVFVMSVPDESWLWRTGWKFWERRFGKFWHHTHVGTMNVSSWRALLAEYFVVEREMRNCRFIAIFVLRKKDQPGA